MDASLQNRLAAVHERTPELLDVLLLRDRQGKGWCCPFCNNGQGRTGDGIRPIPRRPYLLKCFRCGEKMDALDIAGKVLGLSSFADRLAACESLARTDYNRADACRTLRPHQVQPRPQKQMDCSRLFAEAHEHIAETDYLRNRGISAAVAQDARFNLGFAPFYPTGTTRNAIIFPTSRRSYTIRSTDPAAEHSNRYRQRGQIVPFAVESMYTGRPCFVTEGAINALSIVEVGGNALAIGSTEGITAFLQQIDRQRPAAPLLIALDNDQAGERATDRLCKCLDARKIRRVCVSFCRPGMDINDELRSDRYRLTALVQQAERSF